MSEIKGYRQLDSMDIQIINHNKQIEELVLKSLDSLETYPEIDKRWLAIGRTLIEQGFMAMNRSIARPQRLKDEAPPVQ
jgi:hypothetical protein